MELTMEPRRSPDSLRRYLAELKYYEPLSPKEERKLARQFRAGNLRAGQQLVIANLRFVVKIAREYRSYGIALGDLIQEGNLGLIKAVQKFDPSKKIRLISYAVWWIRAYVQDHILRNWSLVKLGTTQAQRKMFYSLARTRRYLENHSGEHEQCSLEKIARVLNVSPAAVEEMQQRMKRGDVSLEGRVGRDGEGDEAPPAHFLSSPEMSQDDKYAKEEEAKMIRENVRSAVSRLDRRERYIIEQRAMADRPITLTRLGEYFGFSRERARQIEIRAKKKLRNHLEELHKLAA
ncbi:MAG TPA: RNA polymerase factor sigma-32 [Myxococcaceae bacterium]|nr:RNA polymerase factor sigma-32 [Myxococcaceae bacterium]